MQLGKVYDPRITSDFISWKVFTRKQMEHICKLEKLPFKDGMTCNEMEVLLISNNVDSKKYKDIIFLGQLYNRGEDRPRNLADKITEDVQIVIEDINFDKMKMYELRQECNLQAIPWKKTDKKVDLIKKLKANGNTH